MIWPWKKKKKRWPYVVASLILFLTAIRLYLPYGLKNYLEHIVNKELPRHQFEIGDLSLSLLKTDYQLEDVRLYRSKRKKTSPLMIVKTFKVDVHPFTMLSDVLLEGVKLEFQHDEKSFGKFGSNKSSNKGWFETIRVVTLGHLQNLIIKNSSVHYRGENPKEEHFYLTKFNVKGEHLYQTRKEDNFKLSGRFMGASNLEVWGKVNVQQKDPEIDLRAKFEKYPLKKINFFFQDYAHYKITKGEVEAYSEIHVKNKKLTAYLKPFVTDLKGEEMKGEESKKFNEGFQTTLKILSSRFLKNDKTESVGTLIPIEANPRKVNVDFSKALKIGIEHAFGEPIKKGFE